MPPATTDGCLTNSLAKRKDLFGMTTRRVARNRVALASVVQTTRQQRLLQSLHNQQARQQGRQQFAPQDPRASLPALMVYQTDTISCAKGAMFTPTVPTENLHVNFHAAMKNSCFGMITKSVACLTVLHVSHVQTRKQQQQQPFSQ